MKTIFCISGSLRQSSSATALLKALTARLEGEASFAFADIGSMPHYIADIEPPESVEAFKQAVDASDGVLIVTPEYNYSIPGVLKNAVDWASRPAYASVFKGKPALVATVSGGVIGGTRAQSDMKYILNGMLAEVFPCQEIIVPFGPRKMTDGVFTDEEVLAFAGDTLKRFIASLSKAG